LGTTGSDAGGNTSFKAVATAIAENGEGHMVQLEKSATTGEYGLHQWELKDGTYSHYFPLDDAVKPSEIGANGTKVILIGSHESDVTIAAPLDAASPSRWISKYLNTRYFQFPTGISIKAREGWDSPRTDKDRNVLRTITGQKSYLDQHSIDSGVERVTGAKIHWWILKDEPAITNNSGFIDSAGHVAALYQNELYDRSTSRAGTASLQRFGILFGYRFVVLYAEPVPNKDQSLTTNTARTTLLINGEKLPWDDWAYEFREKMPKRLAEFINEKAAALTEKDHINNIKDRLKNVMDLYKVIRNQNRLLVNADFRVFKDMIVRLGKEKDGGPGPGFLDVVTEIVHQWFEQALVETIIGIQQLGGSKEWGTAEIDSALSPEALTSAVMQRYHVYVACRRELGAKFGKLAAST
jgi:hypothetical protein